MIYIVILDHLYAENKIVGIFDNRKAARECAKYHANKHRLSGLSDPEDSEDYWYSANMSLSIDKHSVLSEFSPPGSKS